MVVPRLAKTAIGLREIHLGPPAGADHKAENRTATMRHPIFERAESGPHDFPWARNTAPLRQRLPHKSLNRQAPHKSLRQLDPQRPS